HRQRVVPAGGEKALRREVAQLRILQPRDERLLSADEVQLDEGREVEIVDAFGAKRACADGEGQRLQQAPSLTYRRLRVAEMRRAVIQMLALQEREERADSRAEEHVRERAEPQRDGARRGGIEARHDHV